MITRILYTALILLLIAPSLLAKERLEYKMPLLLNVPNDTLDCFGDTDGILTITANTGQAPFTYFWAESTGTASGGGQIGTVGGSSVVAGLSAGSYDVTIVDASNTSTILSALIIQPTELNATITAQTDIFCKGDNTGSFTLLGNGGSGGVMFYEYSIDGVNFSSTNTFNNLLANTYQTVVRDTNGCTTIIPVTITEPAISIGGFISSQTSALCNGDSTGSVTVMGNGGTGVIEYSIDGLVFSTANTFNNLPMGNDTISIRDENGCIFNLPFTITEPAVLQGVVSATNTASSPTSSDGQVTIAVSGGTPNYTYLWNTGATTQTLNNVSPGLYCVTVTDDNGCTTDGCATVTSPGALIMTTTNDTLACFGDATGEIVVTVSGGTAPYAYGWVENNSGATGTGAVLLDGGTDTVKLLPGGVYAFGVQDANNITFVSNALVVEPPLLTINLDHTNIDCFGANNGTLTTNVNGGTPDYTYSWAPITIDPSLTNLAPGVYFVTVSDINGCTASNSATITSPTSTLNAGLTKVDISCNGLSDGQATVFPSGGVPPYLYNWSNGLTTSTITGLSTGLYDVTVTDAANCTTTASGVIVEPFELTTTNTFVRNTLCFQGGDGQAVTVPVGGTTLYTYLWDNSQTVAFADSLTAGTHFVTVTDARGCTASDSIVIGQPTQIIINIVDSSISCNGENDGILEALPSGGTPGYTYSWNTNPFTDTLAIDSFLFAGIYFVTVTDANGCIAIERDTVTQPLAINASFATSSTTCNDTITNNGSATVFPAGGNGNYTYLWSTGSLSTTINNVVQGKYYVTITDEKGCMYEDSTTISSPPALAIGDTSMTVVSCFGEADGTASITPIGGTAPYFYNWLTAPTQNTQTAVSLASGNYQVVVTDLNGCIMDTTSVFVRQPLLPLNATITGTSPICNGGSNGILSTSPAFGGSAPYVYVWSTGDSTFSVFGIPAGTYDITVTDAKGCTTIKDTTLANAEDPTPLISTTSVTCFDGFDGLISVDSAFGGAGSPYMYAFNFGLHGSDSTFVNLPPGDYNVSIRDANGCEADTTVTVDNGIDLVVDLGSDIQVDLGDSLLLNPQVNSTDVASYQWDSIVGLGCTTCQRPLLNPVLDIATYTVTVTDSNGCVATDEIIVRVNKLRNVFIPTGFTPNEDGINDKFVVFSDAEVAEIKSFEVYDRWGNRLHQATNFQPNDETFGWDGFHRSSVMPPGIYVYLIQVEFIDGQVIQYTGDVTLMR